jgi:hypothetical protein
VFKRMGFVILAAYSIPSSGCNDSPPTEVPTQVGAAPRDSIATAVNQVR